MKIAIRAAEPKAVGQVLEYKSFGNPPKIKMNSSRINPIAIAAKMRYFFGRDFPKMIARVVISSMTIP